MKARLTRLSNKENALRTDVVEAIIMGTWIVIGFIILTFLLIDK